MQKSSFISTLCSGLFTFNSAVCLQFFRNQDSAKLLSLSNISLIMWNMNVQDSLTRTETQLMRNKSIFWKPVATIWLVNSFWKFMLLTLPKHLEDLVPRVAVLDLPSSIKRQLVHNSKTHWFYSWLHLTGIYKYSPGQANLQFSLCQSLGILIIFNTFEGGR